MPAPGCCRSEPSAPAISLEIARSSEWRAAGRPAAAYALSDEATRASRSRAQTYEVMRDGSIPGYSIPVP